MLVSGAVPRAWSRCGRCQDWLQRGPESTDRLDRPRSVVRPCRSIAGGPRSQGTSRFVTPCCHQPAPTLSPVRAQWSKEPVIEDLPRGCTPDHQAGRCTGDEHAHCAPPGNSADVSAIRRAQFPQRLARVRPAHGDLGLVGDHNELAGEVRRERTRVSGGSRPIRAFHRRDRCLTTCSATRSAASSMSAARSSAALASRSSPCYLGDSRPVRRTPEDPGGRCREWRRRRSGRRTA